MLHKCLCRFHRLSLMTKIHVWRSRSARNYRGAYSAPQTCWLHQGKKDMVLERSGTEEQGRESNRKGVVSNEFRFYVRLSAAVNSEVYKNNNMGLLALPVTFQGFLKACFKELREETTSEVGRSFKAPKNGALGCSLHCAYLIVNVASSFAKSSNEREGYQCLICRGGGGWGWQGLT